jgi:two-component system osmolarity sensor histidine kinase EnvZ
MMAADIDQLDAIIDKFLDYARPYPSALRPVRLAAILSACVAAVREQHDLMVSLDIPPALEVQADEVDLMRVLANLLENARRYGRSPGTGLARVEISARARADWVMVKVRDHGPGVTAEALPNRGRAGPRHRQQDSAAHGRRVRPVQCPRRRIGGSSSTAAGGAAAGGASRSGCGGCGRRGEFR